MIQPVVLQYTSSPALPAFSLSHNTLSVLEYNPIQLHTQDCNTIFFSYCNTIPTHCTSKSLSHNTKLAITIQLGSSPNQSLHQFFFSFFTIFFLTFPATGKFQKIYIYPFFFHFPEHSNKFIKNYFIQFSSVLHPVKP